MRESIFFASIRAFFIALFAMLGLCIAIVALVAIIGAFSETTTEPSRTYTQEVVANADNERKILSKEAPTILQLNIDGIIGLEKLTKEKVQQQLIESREGDLKNNRVKAILLRINSPGGTVTDSDGIFRSIKNYKEKYKVPVYAHIDGLCASGAMYIACAADKVYSSDASMIGSVGVVTPSFFNLTQLLEKIGVNALTLSAGKDKDQLNPFRPWKEDEDKNLKSIIEFYYQQFVEIVAQNRNISKEKLINDYGAQVFDPIRAKEIGFINEAGTSRNEALKELLKNIGIEDNFYQVVELQKTSWFNELFGSTSNLFSGKIVHQVKLSSDFDLELMNKFLYLYQP